MCSTKRYCAQFYEESTQLWKKIQKGNKTLAEFITKSEESMGEPVMPDTLQTIEAIATEVDTMKKDLFSKFTMMKSIIQRM
jgi:hypothetical protein